MSSEQKPIINLAHPAVGPLPGTEGYEALERLTNYYDILTGYSQGLRVTHGMSDDHVKQLIEKSRQPHIRETTPRDYRERFVSQGAYNRWSEAQPERQIFTLSKKDGDLGGVIWFTPSALVLEEAQEVAPTSSFAIRLYEQYTGRRLARPFMTVAHARMASARLAINGTWLETSKSNLAAVRAYRDFGYVAVRCATETSKDRVHMILSSERMSALNVPSAHKGA